jgi:hypothetical protein
MYHQNKTVIMCGESYQKTINKWSLNLISSEIALIEVYLN